MITARRKEEALLAYELMKDTVLWAESTLKDPETGKLPLRLRDYQKEILRYKGSKRVVRMARRLGKTVTLAVEIIWKCVTFDNRRVLVVTPYQAQIDLIFDFITQMIHDVPEISESCSVKRSPFYEISFGNGSKVKGFTAGTKSGQAAESVRGQDATDIYLDEVDYMGEKAIGAVLAIEMSRPDVRVWASSTPSGKREQFYRWCTQAEALGYKEFHYTIKDSPIFSPAMERKARQNCSDENQYQQEYMAEWGYEAAGVYPQELIDNAIYPYAFKPTRIGDDFLPGCLTEFSPATNIYVMGVDWNGEGVGTRVVIWEWMITSNNPKYVNKIRVFYHENVRDYLDKKGIKFQHHLESTKRVVELAETFNCSHVYLDKGYGHTNYEYILQLYKDKGQLSRAQRIYKPIDFGGKVQVQAPDRSIIEKYMKEFMVSNTLKFFEAGMLILPAVEDEKEKLVGQFREFVVEKVGSTGRRKYTDVNEDSHTAGILGLHALFEEYSVMSTAKPQEEHIGKAAAFRPGMPARDVGDERLASTIPGVSPSKGSFGKLAKKYGLAYEFNTGRDGKDDTMGAKDGRSTAIVQAHIRSSPRSRRTNISGGGRRG